MKRGLWLQFAVAAFSWYNAGVVWLIQFACYPLWPYVGQDEFLKYHEVWWHTTWAAVFIPSALGAVGSVLLVRLALPELPRWAMWVGLGIQAAIQLVTAVWLSPLDRNVVAWAGGLNFPVYEQLRGVNWLRIALVTGYALLTYWMLSRSIWRARSIGPGQWLLLVTSALGLFGVGNVWLVQLVCYRLWAQVGQREAFSYHIAWWHSIWGILFGPSGIVVLGAVALLWKRPSSIKVRLVWLGLASLGLTSIGTGAWWAPLMARLVALDGHMPLRDYELLMSTHWIRVALITSTGLIYFFMLIKSATLEQSSDWEGS